MFNLVRRPFRCACPVVLRLRQTLAWRGDQIPQMSKIGAHACSNDLKLSRREEIEEASFGESLARGAEV